MVDDTLLQFGGGGAEPESAPSIRATVCPRCEKRFSSDGRFCPFDGEPLAPAHGWGPELDPLIGSVVDNRYEVLSVLGEGGMGVVYETRHRALGKRFALKALRQDLATDHEISARFVQEARTAASVSHPGLVEITDFGKLPNGQPFFVMELLEGQSLATLIRRGGPIPTGRALDIVHQLAEALNAAHERSIIHRDLKPDNIHISPAEGGRDRVTIVDFGLAKVVGASGLTRAGMVFGTPHYMSPEQATGEAPDHRADVYALGVVMYEMSTGRVPFEADSYMGVLTKHLYMAPTPPSQLPGTAKLGALEAIILRCLEKQADHRYASLREMIEDMDRVLTTTGEWPAALWPGRRVAGARSPLADQLELPSHEELSLTAERRSEKRTPGWLFSTIGSLFLVGIGAVFVWQSSSVSSDALTSHTASRTTSSSPPVTIGSPGISSPPPAHTAKDPDAATSGVASPMPSPSVILSTQSVPGLANGGASGTGARSVSNAPQRRVQALPQRSAPALSPRRKSAPLGGSEIVDPWVK
jgi:serine/threonine protein kinase